MDHELHRSSNGADVAPGSCAWLRLVRGTSAQPLWFPRCSADENTFSVGSARDSDWRVHADGVEDTALFLRVLADSLFVRAHEASEVTIDGQRVGALWVPVPKGARLSFGTATIEVGLSGRSRAAQSENLHASRERLPELEPADAPFLSSLLFDADAPRCSPATVLDADIESQSLLPARATGMWLTAGSLVACAYGCWVLLLDYF